MTEPELHHGYEAIYTKLRMYEYITEGLEQQGFCLKPSVLFADFRKWLCDGRPSCFVRATRAEREELNEVHEEALNENLLRNCRGVL